MSDISSDNLGDLMRRWRAHRRLSQLALGDLIGVSPRHLSFIETGRAQPSRSMITRLAEGLDLPLRERNALLVAAGFAPEFPEHALDDQTMRVAKASLAMLLEAHEPYLALAIDRHWNLLLANRIAEAMLASIDPALREPPVNLVRASFHPQGLAPVILNLREWREHMIQRLRREAEVSGDQVLVELVAEVLRYPQPPLATQREVPGASCRGVLFPLMIMTPVGEMTFVSTTTVFGSPNEVLLSEVAIETFLPMNEETRERLRQFAEAVG